MRPPTDGAPAFLFVPELRSRADAFSLEGEEARYLVRVVRVREHERVRATDGAGLVATLRVERVRPETVLVVESRLEVERPTPTRVLCGAPEGERGDWLVEKLAELGVTELQPIDTERAHWPAAARDARWDRVAVAALRQSCSAWRLVVRAPVPLAGLLAEPAFRAGPDGGGELRWLADPEGLPPAELPIGAGQALLGAVGPSPGFSDGERKQMLDLSFVPVRLAAHRLRTETAALALAAHWAACRTQAKARRGTGEA